MVDRSAGRCALKVVALAGGVGGAKLADGLYQTLPPDTLTVIGNTADDFTLWGLRISPDLDTVLYTLAGIANPVTGWGIAGDTWITLDGLKRLGVDTWFRVGDQDFATHIRRSELLAQGATLTDVTAQFMAAFGLHARLLPMCDELVATMVDTPDGQLAFQDYFVRRHHVDDVLGVSFGGVEAARITDETRQSLAAANVVVFCPSNPIVSIGPILAVPGFRDTLRSLRVPRVAVSPLVGGLALKGPADKMLRDLGFEATALGVARMYADLLDGMVIDNVDQALREPIHALGLEVLVTDTVMREPSDRRRLAKEILQWSVISKDNR